jgi:putative oxidoreductase
MNDQKKPKEILTFGCAVLLVGLWAYAGLDKLFSIQRFTEQMQLSPLVFFKTLAPVLAILVPLIELLLAALLYVERSRYVGFLCSFLLLLSFEIYLMGLLLSGLDLPCTCGGIISKLSWKGHLWFNAFFMVIALLPFYLSKFQKNIPPRRI